MADEREQTARYIREKMQALQNKQATLSDAEKTQLKQEVRDRVEARIKHQKEVFSCVLALASPTLDQVEDIQRLRSIEGSHFEFDEFTQKYKWHLTVKPDTDESINAMVRQIAGLCSGCEALIKSLVEDGVFASLMYLGEGESNGSYNAFIDPDVSAFLSACQLPLLISMVKPDNQATL